MGNRNDQHPSLVNGKPVRKPRLIQAVPVRDYSYRWISDGCPLHQWCSGASPITEETILHVAGLLNGVIGNIPGPNQAKNLNGVSFSDFWGLTQLLEFLCHNLGEHASKYEPDDEDGPFVRVVIPRKKESTNG